jgi:hypothetical protein
LHKFHLSSFSFQLSSFQFSVFSLQPSSFSLQLTGGSNTRPPLPFQSLLLMNAAEQRYIASITALTLRREKGHAQVG